MNCKFVYMIPELLELDVPGGVVAGISGRNVDWRGDDKLWTHFIDDKKDDLFSEEEDEEEDDDEEDIP